MPHRNKAVPSAPTRRSVQGAASGWRSALLLLVWFLCGTCLIYWFLQARALTWLPNTLASSVQTVPMDRFSEATGSSSAQPAMARVMGAIAPGSQSEDELPQAPSALNAQLLGVLMNGTGRQAVGVALMAVDGQPARVFRLGQEVMPGWQLARIAAKEVTLKQPKAPSGEQVVALAQPSPENMPVLPMPAQAPDGMLQPPLSPVPPGNPEGRPAAPGRFTPKSP